MGAKKLLDGLSVESFDYLRTKLEVLAGISLSEGKADLLIGRLRKRLIAHHLLTLDEYVELLEREGPGSAEWQEFLNCLTTNKTDFFREPDHFNFLCQEALPDLLRQRPRSNIKLWSVPCSTGEEPYTLSMVLTEAQAKQNFTFDISASDIDTKVLEAAKKGVYRKTRLVEVPQNFHREAFLHGSGDIQDWISVKPHLRERIQFAQCNLIAPPFPWKHSFDVIFCRNVLIYFEQDTIRRVVKNLYDVAKPGAYLFVGHSESLQNLTNDWERVHSSVYRKKRS